MSARFKNWYHYLLALLGAVIYRFPARELYVIGITGTKGKTSSAELTRAMLQAAGKKTAMLSSANYAFGEERNSRSGNTMPGRFAIQRFLRQAVESGCTHAVLEVTSQGVVQHRHRFIDFDVAALTNLHPEHIESHGSYEAYREAKVTFFRDVARRSKKFNKKFFINSAIIGGDAQFFEQSVMHPTGKGHFGEVIFYSRENFVRNELGGDKTRVSDWLQSDFNLENAALAAEIGKELGVTRETMLGVCASFAGVDGRLEFIRGNNRTVVVDYALTPESLRSLYGYLQSVIASTRSNPGSSSQLDRHGAAASRDDRQGGRLIAVFGSAGGGRDTWKRPELGRIAGKYCDLIYLTSDDSYDENPEEIIADIKKGIQDAHKCRIVVDRAEAIKEAIEAAEPGDIVAITGMGSQAYTYGPGGKKTEWSDRKEVERVLGELAGSP